MASYSSNESILLSGQVAYFRKVGTMPNHGTLNLADANSAHNYSEGYVGPNSVLHGTDLATTTEYTQCEVDMKSYLAEDWEEIVGERTIITNAENIAERLLQGEEDMQDLADSIPQYTELEYIESSGTQYIDTGINPNNNIKIEFNFTAIEYSGYTDSWIPIFGSRTSQSGTDKFVMWLSRMDTSVTEPDYESIGHMHGSLPTTLTPISTNNFKGIKTLFTKDKNTVLVNNVSVNTLTQSTFTGTYPIVLFSQNTGGTIDARKAVGKLHWCKIYNNDALVRDFIPVQRLSDNAICLYDKVSKTFFTNAGTGTFTAGPEAN